MKPSRPEYWGSLAIGDVFLFEGFRLDRRGGCLFRRDERGDFVPMATGSRALDVLGVLVERAGDLVSREEIIAAVWPSTVVEDNNLNMQIAALRRVLDDGRTEGSYIQTISGRGYRFTAMVTRGEAGARRGATAAPRSSLNSRPLLSIVVLPLTNLSDDREQQYFADGITDDLTTDLSRIAGSFVISRNSAFTYKDKAVNAKQIGRELGVRYVLEGSVCRSGNRVRVNAQLIDAETDAHRWAERFDRDAGDLLALQDEVTRRIAVALNFALVDAEAARPTEHPDALDYIFRGRAALYKGPARDNYAEAIGLFEHALGLDPRSAEAQSVLAGTLAGRAMDGMADTAAADIARAEGLGGQALAASPRSPGVHYTRGQVLRAQAQVLRVQGRCDEAIPEYETAIALNRNLVFPIAALGWCKFLTGSIEDVIPLIEQAIRLSPRDRAISIWYRWIGDVHLLQSRIDESIVWLEKARSANPSHPRVHAWLASAYGLKGETRRAAAELAEAQRLSSDGRFSSIAYLMAVEYFGVPAVRALFEATYLIGLRKAGMPED